MARGGIRSRFLQKYPAQGVLRLVGGALEREVVTGLRDEGGLGPEVEGGVGEDDLDGVAAAGDVGQAEGDLGVGVEQGVVVGVVDEVEAGGGVGAQPERGLERVARRARQPQVRVRRVQVDPDRLREQRRRRRPAVADRLQYYHQVPRQVVRHCERRRVRREPRRIVAGEDQLAVYLLETWGGIGGRAGRACGQRLGLAVGIVVLCLGRTYGISRPLCSSSSGWG